MAEGLPGVCAAPPGPRDAALEHGSVPVCPACGSGATGFWRLATAADETARGRAYPLHRCAACGTAYLPEDEREPQPARLYEGGFYAPTERGNTIVEPLRRLVDRDRLRFLRGLPAGASVFEAGAGDGRFLAAAARAGYRASGLEPSAVAPVAGAAGIPIARARLEDSGAGSHDAVCLFHVLEHLDDPAGALRRVAGLLRPGGLLVVSVPNAASLQAHLGGDAWFAQDVPRHVTSFTPAGLERLLDRAGFTVEGTTTFVLDQTLLGMQQTLLNRLTQEKNVLLRLLKRRPVSRRDTAVTLAAALPAALAALTLEGVAASAGRGGAVVVRARLREAP